MEHTNYSKEYVDIHKRLRRPTECREKKSLPYLDSSVHCFIHNSKNMTYLIGRDSYACEERTCEEYGATFPAEHVKEQPSDDQIERNITFPYLLLREGSPSVPLHQYKRVTILLHGLNERTLLKYMPWAYHIWQRTQEPVVLFPLSFSINRVLPEWRKQMPKIHANREKERKIKRSHEFNATISERLEPNPERFFWGAEQSYWDIIDFVREIRSGENEQLKQHFDSDARINFLGYSSGGYLALAHLAVNHEGLFSESRACLFASCVEMDDLRPASPYVVDEEAERALRELYVDYFDELPDEDAKNAPKGRMRHWLEYHPEGRWLCSFGGHLPNRKEKDRANRESHLRKLAERLLGIANTNDMVMPWRRMRDVLLGDERDTGVRFKKLDLGIHEHPFVFPNYNQSESEFILGTIDWELYGDEFEQFISWIIEHLEK
ncbi:MAG: DUF6051 family protein [Pyrinomonadaceae bacterium]